MANNTLLEKSEFIGNFFLPNNPDTKAHGKLTFDPLNHMYLVTEVTSLFNELQPPSPTVFTLNGILEDGSPCTLFDCFIESSNYEGRLGVFKTVVNFVVIGKQYSAINEVKIKVAKMSFPNLTEWVNPILVDISYGPNVERKMNMMRPSVYEYNVTSIPGKFIIHTFADIIKNDLNFSVNISNSIIIEFDIEKSLFDFLKFLFEIKTLFYFFISEKIFFENIFISDDVGENRPEHRFISGAAYFEGLPRKMKMEEMSFPFGTIAPDFLKIMNKWFSISEEYSNTANLCFYNIYNESMAHEYKFISMIQAIESFHRIECAGQYMEASAYETIRSTIVASIPENIDPSLKEALKNRLKFGNEFSLRKRIKELLNSIPAQLKSHITNNDKRFITDVVELRNYLAHYHKDPPKTDQKTIYDLSMSLRGFILILFFRKLEVGDNEILNYLERNKRKYPAIYS